MTRFRLTELAERDLEGIVDLIADDGGADRVLAVLSDFAAAFELLAGQPRVGNARRDLAEDELRFWIVHRFLVAYRSETDPLEIVRVLHGARDPATLRRVLEES